MKIKSILLIVLITAFTSKVYAALDDFEIASWNMQGANASTENKWRGNIIPLILGGAEIILMQEAGQVPQSATPTGRQFNTSIPVTEHIWNIQSRSRERNFYIYFTQTDIRGNRVNLAILSRVRADDVYIISPTSGSARPTLGIQIGSDAYFTIHAASPGGNDAPRLIEAVSDFFQNNSNPALRNVQWMIGGDYNRSPDSLQMALNPRIPHVEAEIVHNGQPTQASGGELDYAVIGGGAGALQTPIVSTLFFAERLGQIASDHIPVGFYSTTSR